MAKMQKELAAALAVIGKEETELETKANGVLRLVKRLKLNTAKDFNKAVREAYQANGWNARAGKPAKGSEAKPVPSTVKQYVSTIRGAYRLGLMAADYSSFYALRTELRAKRAAKAKRRDGKSRAAPEMIGIQISRPDVLTGGPFHDLVALYNALDRTRRAHMLSAIARVKREFSGAAPQLVMASLPEMRKAA